MEANARLFYCVSCRSQAFICSCCDRGNIYCSTKCSQLARQQSLRAAGKRYQNSFQGKLKHAARQKSYSDRLKKKMTHHTSPAVSSNDLLSPQPNEQKIRAAEPITCHFCGNNCAQFIRLRFLHRRTGSKARSFAAWPSGP